MQAIKFDLRKLNNEQIRSLSATLEIKAAKRNGYTWFRESINGRWSNDRFLYVSGNAIAYGNCPFKFERVEFEDKTEQFKAIWK
jgi:hypothetical protein